MWQEDYMEDYEEVDYNLPKKRFNFKFDKKIVIIIGIVAVLIVGITTYNKTIVYHNSYEYLEDTIEEKARQYVLDNGLKSDKEYYLEASKLGVTLKDDCLSVSGVFINGDNYQAYLLCNEYETKIITNSDKYITLNGKNITFLNKGINYVESSYSSEKTVSVNINGKVGTEVGVYEVEYIVMQYSVMVDRLTRKVVVLDNDSINDFYPTIKLLGDSIEYLQLRGIYQEKGATASDKFDGVINDIKINGTVNTAIDGEYNLTYVALNSRGYANSVTRKVIVSRSGNNAVLGHIISPTSLTNGSVKITIRVFGNNYSYTVLPNGEKKEATSFNYEVSENGTYTFKVYDLNGNYQEKQISISNIDTNLPTGSCSAIVTNNGTSIYVNANDNQGISGYSYVIDGIASQYFASNQYTVSSMAKSVYVNVKDISSNVKRITCSITDKSTDNMGIVPIPTKSFPCNTNVTVYNAQLASKVASAGLKTRKGVAAAANYLATELGYKIEYWWAGKYNEVGLNREWGCDKAIWATDGHGRYEYGNVLPYGMDCTGFVKWAFINGGFDASLIPRSDMANAKFGGTSTTKVAFSDNSGLINNLKMGDLLYTEGHIALVVGVDSTRIKIAQLTPRGLSVDLVDKRTGSAINAGSGFTHYVLLDAFYAKHGK